MRVLLAPMEGVLDSLVRELLTEVNDCRFNWSTQQLCENMGLRRFFE